MMDFRHTIEQFSALRFVAQEVEFCASPGRQAMLNTRWMTSPKEINEALDKVDRFYGYLRNPALKKGMEELELLLEGVANIEGSIRLLQRPDSICTDVDFFEMKKLAIIEEKAGKISRQFGIQLESKPTLEKVLEILDPETQRIPTFFLAPIFEPLLGVLRKEQEQAKGDESQSVIAEKIARLEDKVRERITRKLAPFSQDLLLVLRAFAEDILALGKAKWAINNGAVRPQPLDSGLSILEDVVHPEVKAALREQGLAFQPVSISFDALPTLITGANMAGKSVLLSSIALSQLLMQYGWFVLAKSAKLSVVDEVMVSLGDGQDLSRGLSSFGAEMMRMDAIIKAVKDKKTVLALIDEPARSTNPTEGHALVSALVALFNKYHVRAILTTHYSNIDVDVKRWRVKGFVEERLTQPLRINQLNQCIDYSLEEDHMDDVPKEALRIARILGVDEELLDMCNI